MTVLSVVAGAWKFGANFFAMYILCLSPLLPPSAWQGGARAQVKNRMYKAAHVIRCMEKFLATHRMLSI